MSSVYPEFWRLGSYKYPMYRSKLHSLFKLYVRKSGLVLDAGCGDKGGYLHTMSTNIQGVGLDIKRTNIERLAKKSKNLHFHNLSFLVGDLEKIPFRKNIFDVIICCDVLEHVNDSEKGIKELASSLKKGGKLLTSTSNAFNPAMFVDGILPKKVSYEINRRFGVFHYERTYRLNPWNIVEKLKRYGFKVEKLLMSGYPPIGRPWIYHFSKIKPPKIFYLWIVFDKLTNFGFLRKFKENILVDCSKIAN